MRTNRIKEKFRGGQAVVGIEIGIPDPILVNALSKVGFDFMMLDMEHTSIDRAVLPSLIIALEASETEADRSSSVERFCDSKAGSGLRSL